MSQSLRFLLRPSVNLLIGATVLGAIAPSVLAQPPQAIAQSKHSALSEQQIAEQFADLVAAGQYEEARQYLHPVLAAEWTADVLEERWTSFQQRTGVFVQREEARMIGQLVIIYVEFADVSEDLIFIFDDEQRIAGIDFPLQPIRFVGE